MPMKLNGCVHILSGRVKCLKMSLESFYDNYNRIYDYPVYVYYFDPLYSKEHINDIHISISPKINFIELDYSLPKHFSKSELFLYRDNDYAKKNFGTNRIGYLHMINYFVNFFDYEKTQFSKYDYTMSFDDESLFLKPIEFDIFEKLKEKNILMGSMNVTKRNIPPSQRTLDTRENQFEFVKYYIEKYRIHQDTKEFNLLLDPNSFHSYTVTDSNVFNLKLLNTKAAIRWRREINKYAGTYKHRWGDHELNALFWIIHYKTPFYDFELVKDGYLDPGGLRYVQDYTPGVKNFWK